MAKFTGILVFTLISFLIYFLGAWVITRFTTRESFGLSLFFGLVALFWLLGLSYKRLWDFNRFRDKKVIYSLSAVILLLVLSINHNIIVQCRGYFSHLNTTEGKHWRGKVFVADPVYGHRPIPCSDGRLTLNYKGRPVHDIPIRHDAGGFRISDSASCATDTSRPRLLFLGCSFTEGADCRNEETFASMAARQVHGATLNAAVSSYGYGQMLVSAREMVPLYKPDYLIVQCSPWLSERAADRYAPSYGLRIPSPYFVAVDDKLVLRAPAYPSRLFSMQWEYDSARSKLYNFLYFLFTEGYAAYAYDGWHYLKAMITTPSPVTDRARIEKAFFEQVQQIASENKVKMIVLNLGDLQYTARSHELVGPGVRFAEADSLLWSRAGNDEKAYARQNYIWGNNGKEGPAIIDRHPSATAHRTISEAIVKALQ